MIKFLDEEEPKIRMSKRKARERIDPISKQKKRQEQQAVKSVGGGGNKEVVREGSSGIGLSKEEIVKIQNTGSERKCCQVGCNNHARYVSLFIAEGDGFKTVIGLYHCDEHKPPSKLDVNYTAYYKVGRA